MLVTTHVIYGAKSAERIPELKAIADWLATWAADINAFGHNLLLLGDFNIDRKDDPLWQTFTSTGLTVPKALHHVPRTINGAAKGGSAHKHYDQIAYFQDRLSLTCTAAGSIDFVSPLLRRKRGLADLSWKLSDHLPLWVEFGV